MTDGYIYDGQVWGDDGINTRKAANRHHSGLMLPSVRPFIITNLTRLYYLLILCPMDYVKGTMLPGMNRRLPDVDPHVSEHEFIKWLGMWLVIGCYEGNWGRQDWWSKDDIRIGKGPPFRLNDYMRHARFEKILTRIKCTDKETPHYVDSLFHVRKLVEAWNANMSTNLIPGWISCLEESIMTWKNNFDPGWVVIPRNTHPFGN